MWFREKLRVVLTTILITDQITTSHCVPSVSRKDAFQRNLETKGNKIPFGNNYKHTSPETSMYKAYNFPEIEFPQESSLGDPLYSGRNLNKNTFNTNGVTSLKCKACNDLKKDIRMKRKLDRIHENYKTNIPNLPSDPVTIKLTDTDMFPEVKYPLNTIDMWEPHYWDPSVFNQKEKQYIPSDFPIFNSKISDKDKMAGRPYKKQTKSKIKQFMEDIDLFNEKMRSSRSQSQKTIEANTQKDSAVTYSNNSESFKQTDSNDINVLRMGVEAIPNNTTEINHDAITYQCLPNTSTTESRELNNLSLSQVNSAMTNSQLSLTSKMERNNLDVTPIPIPYKALEKNFSSDFESNNVKDKYNMNPFTDGKTENVSNEPPYFETADVLDEDIRRIILNTTNISQQQPGKIVSHTDRNNSTTATASNDDPLNVKIPIPEIHYYDKMRKTDSMTKNTQLSRSNTHEHTLANIFVIPISNSANKKQIQIVESSTGSPIIVFLPSTEKESKATITPNDIHYLPLITETESNDAFSNISKTSDVYKPLQINVTDLPDISSDMMEMPIANDLDIPCATISDMKLLLPDLEMLPNTSMCHVLPNEANSTNMIIELYNATESSEGILSVIDIPFSVENVLENYTQQPNIGIDDIKDNKSLLEVVPKSHVHTDMDKTARLLAVSKLFDLLLKDLVKKDPFMLVDKILPEKSMRDMVINVEELPCSKDIVSSIQGTIMPNDIKDIAPRSEKSNIKNNVTIVVNVLQQNPFMNITRHISAPRQNENSPLSEDIRENVGSPFSMKLSDKFVNTQLTPSNIENVESLVSSEELTAIPLKDGIEDNKSLPFYRKLPDNLLTDKAFLDSPLTSNDNKSLEPSDTAGNDMEFSLPMTDRFVSTSLTPSDDGSLDSLPRYKALKDIPLSDNKEDDISSPMSMNLPKSLVTDKPFDGAPWLSSGEESLHSLQEYEDLIDATLIDNIGDDISLSMSRQLSDSSLTDEALLDIPSISNDHKSFESLPVSEELIGSPFSDTLGVAMSLPLSEKLSDGVDNTTVTLSDNESLDPSDTAGNDMEVPLSMTDRFVSTSLTPSDDGSLDPLSRYEALQDIPLSDNKEDDISSPMSMDLPVSLVTDKPFDGAPWLSSGDESIHSLQEYENLIDATLIENIGDDTRIPLSMTRELSDSSLTDEALLDISSISNDYKSFESLPVYEELIGSPFSDTIGVAMSLPLSEKLSDGVNNTTVTSSDNESLKLLPDYEELAGTPFSGNVENNVLSWMDLPDSLLTNETFNDTVSTSNHNGSTESIPVNDVLIDTTVIDTLENDTSLPLSTKLPDRLINTLLTTSNIGSLESLPDYEELTGTSFSDSIEDDSSLSSSLEGPYTLLTNEEFLDTSSSNSDSLEALSMYETLAGSPLDEDVSSSWSIELPDRFVDIPLTSNDIESLESDYKEPIPVPLSGAMEDDMSLPKEFPNSLPVNNAFHDTSLISDDYKNLESLQHNQALSANPSNDNTWDDMLPVQLSDKNDEKIEESHSTNILHEGVFMDKMEPDIMFTENDKRLLARNTIPDSQESNIKVDEVLLSDKVTNDQISVNKNNANVKFNNMPESEAVKELLNKQLFEITTDDKPLYVDETLKHSGLLNDSPLEINRISIQYQTVPTPKTKVIFGDLTSSINKKVPLFMDEQLTNSELFTSIVKYLYDTV